MSEQALPQNTSVLKSIRNHEKQSLAGPSNENPTSNPLPTRRAAWQGYSLIEVLTTLSLLSLLALSTVGILNAITKNSIQSAHAKQSRKDALRIAEIVREDAAKALSTTIDTSGWPVTLEYEKSKTIYAWNELNGTLTRTEIAGGSNRTLERFLLPKQSKPRVTISNKRMKLQIDLPNKQTVWVIEARLKNSVTPQRTLQ